MAAAFLAGALAALAMPPLYWLPLAVLGIVAFVWLWQTAPGPKSALLRGWAWGSGHFAVGSYWIVEAFFVPPADYAWLGVPIVAALAVYLGLFPGLAAGLTRRLVERWPALGGRYRRLVLLAIAWTAAEWLRGHLLTGYSWNPLGHVWAFAAPLLQSAALFGVYGLGTLTFLILAAPTAGWRAAIAALVALGVAGFAGQSMMEAGTDDGPWMRIVQPNVAQAEKWRPENRARLLAELVEMSRRPGFDRLAAVVWPETAPPFVIEPGSPALAIMARAVPPGGYLLAGAPYSKTRSEDGVWNSLLAIDGTGAIVASYDKVHLVPLGEYIPLHKQLAPVSGFIGRGSFEEGDSRVTISLPALRAFLAGNLLRGDLPGRRYRSRRSAALAAEHHQRRLVRDIDRALPASGQRPPARGRGGAADDPCGQHRRIRRDRRVWSGFGLTRHAATGHHRPSASAGARGHALQPLGRLDAAGAHWISGRSVVGWRPTKGPPIDLQCFDRRCPKGSTCIIGEKR